MDNKADIINTYSLLDWAPGENEEAVEMGLNARHRAGTAEPVGSTQPVRVTYTLSEDIETP